MKHAEDIDDVKPDAAGVAMRVLEVARDLATELSPHHELARAVTLDCMLDRDLGLDSLGRVELLVRLEKVFDVKIPEQVLGTAETPRDLLRAVLMAQAHGRVIAPIPRDVEKLSLGEGAVAAPKDARTLVDVLEWHVCEHPDQLHIRLYGEEDDGETLTYRQLYDGAAKIAAGLQRRGIEPREAVLIMLPTGRDYFFTFMGILLAGGVPVPVYPPGRLSQIEEHLRRQASIANNCLARMIVTVPEAMKLGQMVQFYVPRLEHLVTPTELAESEEPAFGKVPAAGSDTAFLQYTSGSTGDPKGVILTHDNLLANLRVMGQELDVTAEDVFVSWLPLYHDMGLIGAWFGTMYYGVPLVIMSPLTFIARPERWLWAIHKYGGTLSACPNFAFELCMKRVDKADIEGLDLSSLRKVLNGAEGVGPDTVVAFTAYFSDYGLAPDVVMPVYGLAECSVGLAFPPLERAPLIDRVRRDPLMKKGIAEAAQEDDADPLRFVACGRPLPGHEIRIVDADDRELPERREGYIQFRGPSATSGYMRAPDKTRALFHGDWLDTGDMGYISGGDIYITGRKKDIVIRAGQHIYPEELEQDIGAIPGIRAGRVTVFGSRDPGKGSERLVVLAETREEDEVLREKLRREINAAVTVLAGEPPDDVVLAPPDTVLKTSSGKLRRSASRELYESGAVGAPRRAIWRQLARIQLSAWLAPLRRCARSALSLLYAGWVWCVALLVAAPSWFLIVLSPVEAWRWKLARGGLETVRRLSGIGISVIGLENLPQPSEPRIFVSNHQSYLDGFAVTLALLRKLSFIAKEELRQSFFAGLLLARMGCVFVERFDTMKSIESAKAAGGKGHAGGSLVFFAEGTLTRAPGLRSFKLGAFEIAAREKLPVIPLAIRGTRSVLRDVSWFPRRGNITVVIGPAIDAASIFEEKDGDVFATAIELRDRARDWILRHCGEPDIGGG